jgi:hypothetical protein
LVWSKCGSRSPQSFSQKDARIIGWGKRDQAHKKSTTMVVSLREREEEEEGASSKKQGERGA